MLRAVTYDYWQTLLWEEPGHLERERVSLWHEQLSERGHAVQEHALQEAHALAFATAAASWLEGTQFQAADAARMVCARLGLEDEATHELITSGFFVAGERTLLHEAPGVRAALEAWRARGVKLGIVCDVGLTPSSVLLNHLERRGLLELFDAWSFSDRTGVYKPQPAAFAPVLEALGVRPEEAAHVGDRSRTDVAGARAVGMTSVRYTGIFDDPDEAAVADHVLAEHADVLTALGQG